MPLILADIVSNLKGHTLFCEVNGTGINPKTFFAGCGVQYLLPVILFHSHPKHDLHTSTCFLPQSFTHEPDFNSGTEQILSPHISPVPVLTHLLSKGTSPFLQTCPEPQSSLKLHSTFFTSGTHWL